MARLTKERMATVALGGEEVRFFFRDPSNQELNEFLSSRWETGKKGKVTDNSLARSSFFDKLLTRVENLEDPDGNSVTPERKELIPLNWKNDIIFKLFESTDIEVKN